jgi:hypothetical protein
MIYTTIHQPYFLPWLGYFTKLIYSKHLVILDDVYFRDRFYHKRALFRNTKNDDFYISLPVGHNYQLPIKDVILNHDKRRFLRKSITTLKYSYSRFDFFNAEGVEFFEVYEKIITNETSLLKINDLLLRYLLEILSIDINIIFSSELVFENYISKPTERYLRICENLKSNEIITGVGKSNEVHDFLRLKENGIKILTQNFFKSSSEICDIKFNNIESKYSVVHNLFKVGRECLKEYINHRNFLPTEI